MDDMAMKEMKDHLSMHVEYPASKKMIVEACNMMSHVPEEARKMVDMKLMDMKYNSVDDVMKAMGM